MADPITISGGSVEIDFDDTKFHKNNRKHYSSAHKIKRVEITGDISYAADSPGGKCIIKIITDDGK